MALTVVGGIPAVAGAATVINSYTAQGGATFGSGGGFGNGSSDIAVSPTTDRIFIAQLFTSNIEVLSADPSAGGTTLTSFNANTGPGFGPQDVAVDPTNDTVYQADSFLGVGVARFISDGAPTPTYTYDPTFAPTGLAAPAGLAVNPITHDVLVVDRGANRVVRLAASDGHEIASLDGSNTAAGAFGGVRSVAVGPTGLVYVSDQAGRRVERFSAAGASLGAFTLPAGSEPSAITTNENGDVAVITGLFGQTYLRTFTAAGAPRLIIRLTNYIGSPVAGLAWNAGLSRFYVSRADGTAFTLIPGRQPGLDAPAVAPGRNTAHVSTQVAPGGDDTRAWFEYCPTTVACDNFPVSSNDPSDTTNPWRRGPLHENLTATSQIEDDLPLSSNATWQVRAVAENTVSGTDNTSAVTTITTPLLAPGVTTDPASSVTDSSVQLNGTIDALAAPTTYHFEYGLTTSYGSRIPAAAEASAGNNRTPRAVNRIISGLQSGTTYHFRLVAKNAVGEVAGADRTFTTTGPDEVAPRRAYEQVTPQNKHGAQVVSDYHVQSAPDGSVIAVSTLAASRDAEGSLIRQNYVSRRSAADWLDWRQTDAPQAATSGLLESSTAGVSPDFSHALVMSNRVLAPGGIAGGGNLYVKDLDIGGYTFVGGAPGNEAYNLMVGIQVNEQIFLASAPDMSWVLFWAQSSLLPGAPARAIYRWSRSTGLQVESRLPDNTVPSGWVQLPTAQITWPVATPDGRVVVFALPDGAYRREDGQTKALSVSRIAGDPTTPQPAYIDGVTPDGRYTFFSSGRLTNDAPAGETSLYRYDAGTDELRFLGTTMTGNPAAVLGIGADGQTVYFDAPSSTMVWHAGQLRTVTTERNSIDVARPYVTTNGRFFAWQRDDGTLRVYDADQDHVSCVSCLSEGDSGTGGSGLQGSRSMGNYAIRNVSETGTVFFNTKKRLLNSDQNGSLDVYAYKNGKLTLISPGDSNSDAFFVDASADGSSVFFQTDEGLVSRDVDGESDVYVARVGGGLANQNPPPAPAPCVRAECAEVASGPTASPAAASSGTTGSSGAKRTNQQKVRITLNRISFGSKTVKVTFHANQRGRVRVSGSRVTTTIRNVGKSGTYSVSVPLTKKARALRSAHRKFKVSLRVSLSGGWGSAAAKYTRTLGK